VCCHRVAPWKKSSHPFSCSQTCLNDALTTVEYNSYTSSLSVLWPGFLSSRTPNCTLGFGSRKSAIVIAHIKTRHLQHKETVPGDQLPMQISQRHEIPFPFLKRRWHCQQKQWGPKIIHYTTKMNFSVQYIKAEVVVEDRERELSVWWIVEYSQ